MTVDGCLKSGRVSSAGLRQQRRAVVRCAALSAVVGASLLVTLDAQAQAAPPAAPATPGQAPPPPPFPPDPPSPEPTPDAAPPPPHHQSDPAPPRPTISEAGATSLLVPTQTRGYGVPRPRETQGAGGDSGGPSSYGDLRVILSFENLFGYSSTHTEFEIYGIKSRTNEDKRFALFGGGVGAAYTAPRLAIDGVVGRGLTLGGSLGVMTIEQGSTDVGGFMLAGRVGYVFGRPHFGVWLRGGLSHFSESRSITLLDEESESATSGTALTLEFLGLAGSLHRHVAVSFGPAFFIPVSGEIEVDGATVDAETTAFTFAVSGHFLL